VFCPKCGTAVPEKLSYCQSCGCNVSDVDKTHCPRCDEIIPENSTECPNCFLAICPKCGVAMSENSNKCSKCDYVAVKNNNDTNSIKDSYGKFDTYDSFRSTPQKNVGTTINTDKWDKVRKIAFPILGVIVLVLCFAAASTINKSGNEIMQISSVGGRTLDEAYYRELGGIYSGYANIARAIGISLAAFLVWLGFKK